MTDRFLPINRDAFTVPNPFRTISDTLGAPYATAVAHCFAVTHETTNDDGVHTAARLMQRLNSAFTIPSGGLATLRAFRDYVTDGHEPVFAHGAVAELRDAAHEYLDGAS